MDLKAPQLLAGDTNIGLDLAHDHGWVTDAIFTIRRRLPECSVILPPTVSEELAWLAIHAEETSIRNIARSFLLKHRDWGFQLLHTVPLGDNYVAKIAERLQHAALLPSSEANDALILAETAALGCSILLTSDQHLRGVDFQRLSFELKPFDLTAPVIATPREIVRKFFH